ncbi:UNVERIFIED_CONTAM: hypothetical protein K2H54_048689, partial [Gekko kuhli]
LTTATDIPPPPPQPTQPPTPILEGNQDGRLLFLALSPRNNLQHHPLKVSLAAQIFTSKIIRLLLHSGGLAHLFPLLHGAFLSGWGGVGSGCDFFSFAVPSL